MPLGDKWECFVAHEILVYKWKIECGPCHHTIITGSRSKDEDAPPHPDNCPACGTPYDNRAHESGSPFYIREDTAEIFCGHPPGMMIIDPWWAGNDNIGPDGHCLLVYIPHYIGPEAERKIAPDGQPWYVDSIAGNCTVPCKCGKLYVAHNKGEAAPCEKFDPADNRAHRCWVREGVPPDVHVSKEGLTCGAGGGSIQGTNWHGFLRHGFLYEE